MVMDSQSTPFPYSDYGVNLDNGCVFPYSNEYQNFGIPSDFEFNDQSLGFNSINAPNFELSSGFEFNEPSLGFNPMSMDVPVATSIGFSSFSDLSSLGFSYMDKEGSSDSPSSDIESGNSVLEYISQVLMEEEDMEGEHCMFHDALALQATEQSLYEVLGESSPPMEQPQTSLCANESSGSLDCLGTFSDPNNFGRLCHSSNISSMDPPWNVDLLENNGGPLQMQTPVPANIDTGNGVLGSSISDLANPNCFLQNDWTLQFNKGMLEASKFLPKLNHLTVSLENIASASEPKEITFEMNGRAVQEKRKFSPSHLTGKKNRERGRDEELEEARNKNNKQSAVSVDEGLSELFDIVVIDPPPRICKQALLQRARLMLEQKEQTNGSSGGKARAKKKGDKKKVIDLRTLLIFSAQAVSSNDLRTANEHLNQVRRHSSRFGDGYQRLACVFADALEARMAGTGPQIYASLSSIGKSTAEILKSYELYISACPFQRSAIIFANRSIMKFVKEKKATTLHIIDFGIFYGFQWPALIMRFLETHGGPIKLRITGIDIPMPGFRPAETVQETGRRLARYCERFNVPFEYTGIAQTWETIQVKDLNLRPDEVVVANCLYRFHNLLDDTVVMNNPRDAVLDLIRKINPDMFIHSIVNGSFRTPFFLTRFKDVLFHYSSLFDMFDSRIPREDKVRLLYEQERFKREVMNVVACEGTKRVERPESYKQWQVRTARAGFRQRDLDHNLLNKLRGWLKDEFQDIGEFTMETDGQWMLQGWKGRILFASSIWLPA